MDDVQQLRMQYLGVLNLLARSAVYLPHSADEDRDLIERALTDAQKFFPRLQWRRILDSFEVEMVEVGDAG